MTTRCKVMCQSVTKAVGFNGVAFIYNASFGPVYADTPENKAFFAATPCVQMQIGTVREDHFVPGRTYFVDFSPAD